MPIENNFQHDELSRKHPGERLTSAEFTPEASPDSPPWIDAMVEYGSRMSSAGVRAIVFLHGAIHGTDVFGMERLDDAGGLKRGYSRGVSGLDALLAAMRQEVNGIPFLPGGLKPPLQNDDATKKLLDEQLGDAGNFTHATVNLFQRVLNKSAKKSILCLRTLWSAEHHHLGRASAAVHLLETLRALCKTENIGEGERILVQAHGQAGLV